MSQLRRWRQPHTFMFDLGNSNRGPVGAVIEVKAVDKRAALRLAKRVADAASEFPAILRTEHGEARFYLNSDHVMSSDGWRED